MKNYWILFAIMFYISACQQNTSTEQHTHQSSKEEVTENTAENFDCGNCGMPSNEFPQFHAKIQSKDQKTVWFCSTRCMFIGALKPGSPYEGASQRQVMDYYENKFIDAESAIYVMGSDVPGPMGADLIPHKDQQAAEEFMKEHQGKKMLKASEVNKEIIKEMMMK